MRSRMQKPAVAQLAHVELLTPNPEETLWFFKELLGLEEVDRKGQSVYLRAYEDFYHHSLKITEAPQAGLGHLSWRTSSPEALEQVAQTLEKTGAGRGWSEGDIGHGPAYQFITPGGHNVEILWEVDYYKAPMGKESKLRSRPQRRPLRGIPVRRIDHVNLMSPDVTADKDFFQQQLDFMLRESKIGKGGTQVAAWLSVTNLAHDMAITRDASGASGRLHHIAFWYGFPQHLFDLADTCSDYDIQIELGPGKHGATQGYYLYVFEPGGNRIEFFGDTGYLIFDPAWETIVWDVANESDLAKSSVWFGSGLPETFYNYGTPDIKKSE